MTTDKARKRAVRSRMEKTGERYAAARRHVVQEAGAPATAGDRAVSPPLPPRVTEPTMSEATIRKGTGRTWDEWFRVLDDWDATSHDHTEIARYVREAHGVDGWWAQGVTVGYEWARGMRQRHETPGGFQVSVTRTIGASADDVWHDFVDRPRRDRWLPAGTLRRRPNTGTPAKSARFDAADGRTVLIYLTGKGVDRSSVAVTCEGLVDRDEVEAQRAVWRAHLTDLADRWSAPSVTSRQRRAS